MTKRSSTYRNMPVMRATQRVVLQVNQPAVLGIGIVFLLVLIVSDFAYPQQKHSFVPSAGFAPDETTAIRIAEAVLTPIYGGETVKNEKPFTATLKGNIWIVRGSLPKAQSGRIAKGGVSLVELSKTKGCVLRVSHGK